MAQGQDGEQEPGTDDGHVPQFPQPQLGLCFQVVGVDKNRKHLLQKRDRHVYGGPIKFILFRERQGDLSAEYCDCGIRPQ